MPKVKSWWSDDGKWFCMLVNDGVNQATVSLTPDEAKALAREADPEIHERLAMVRRQRDQMTDAFNATLRVLPCDCGAETTGKWADKHEPGCASLRG